MGAIVHRLVLVTTLALAALAPASARAQATDMQARDLYVQGDRYYAEGRYELAVQAFQESYRLSGRPLLLFNLANALERIGRYAEALDALRRYQPSAPPHEQMALRTRIATLEQRAAQQPAPPATPASSGDSSLMLTGFLVGGAGVALTVVGIVMGVLALDARAQAESGCVATETGTVCDASVRGALEDDATFALIADLGVGVGAAALAAGIVLVIVGAASSDGAPSAAIPYVAPRAEGAEVGVVVAF